MSNCCATEPETENVHHDDHGHEHHHDHNMSHDEHSCGHDGGGHGGHGDHAAMFRNKFWISLALTIPTVIYSHMLMELFGYMPPTFPGSEWIAPVFGMATFLYGGPVFLKAGWGEIKARKPGMMLLISMGLLVALVSSIATELGWIDVDLWFELATLVTIMLLGHWIEMRAVGQTQDALSVLAKLLPDDAEKLEGDDFVYVSISDLERGDVVLVRAGGRVPADGEIIDGSAELDESMLTGESRAVAKTVGDSVIAGTVVTDSAIRVVVKATGDETALAGISRLVEQAQHSKSRAQALADRFAALLFYVALLAGFLTLVIWSALGETTTAIENTVTVLIIACPHALGLAIPLTISVSTGIAAKAGILVKDRMALEKMRTVDVVLFDKTGTLTKGAHEVTDVVTHNFNDVDFLNIAAAVERDSEHPLARAIVAHAEGDASFVSKRAENFTNLPGRGVKADVDGSTYHFGGPAMLRELNIEAHGAIVDKVVLWKERGSSILYGVQGNRVIGAFALDDQIRPESFEAIHELKRLGVKAAMVTGDAQQVADAVGRELGLDEIFAEVLPQDKDAKVQELQERGYRVAMVGDGVNDAPALARADVGIAVGAGTDVAIESAGVVLASSDPRNVIGTIKLSKASYSKMIQNLTWGAGYNLFSIPIAAGVLYPWGISLTPALGAVLMSASTVIVAFNAQLMRRVKLTNGRRDDDVRS
jgi:Cu2+-exporting ATPase